MKTLVALILVGLLGFILINRQRVYVRDPLATVFRDATKQPGVQVFIDYSNDVLLERDAEPGSYRLLVQHWNERPGTPAVLKCLRWMVCLADADHATTIPVEAAGGGPYRPQVTMSDRVVSFVDGDGTRVRVTLR